MKSSERHTSIRRFQNGNSVRKGTSTKPFDVVIVGAGAAGIGMGVVLRELGMNNYAIFDRHEVAASFLRWPKQMRFISPSFASNGFGLLDLNAVTLTTSPAHTLKREHPSGVGYARYLQAVAKHFELPIKTGIDVLALQPLDEAGEACAPNEAKVFRLDTNQGKIWSRMVVWAAGEFQYPHLTPFAGAEHCLHNAMVADWDAVEGDDFIVVGGYESGIDVAINLAQRGKRVRVVDAHAPWESAEADPSLSLSPYTRGRLERAQERDLIELLQADVLNIEQCTNGYNVSLDTEQVLHTPVRPILATGFTGSLSLIREFLEWRPDERYPLLSEQDESTITPGLFLAGPFVRHGNLIFCFIYKFRQRFAVVANAIGTRLGIDTSLLEEYRRHNMYLDDLSCCDEECVC